MIFPDAKIEDLANDDPLFHVMYDLDDRVSDSGNALYLGPADVHARQRGAEMAGDSR